MLAQSLRLVALLAFVVLRAAPAFATQVASGTHGAVAADHRLASEAGIEILRSGGNAVDAAVAASLVIGVVNPSSAGLGGGGFMVVYNSVDGRAHAIDYRERAPAAATPDMYQVDGVAPRASRRGGLAVAVPGEAAGLEFVLSRFGTMDMAAVAAPAIRLAEQGFEVEAHLAERIDALRQQLAQEASLAAGFLHTDGSPYRQGETLRRPDLARTLRILARRGAGEFYEGEIAEDLVTAVRRSGGLLSRQDLADYRVLERKPLIASYRGMSVIGMPPPSSGGATIAATLNVLSGYRLADLGPNSTTYLHLLIETFKAVFADRAAWYGDPDFVTVPLERLVSMQHALEIRRGLSAIRPAPPDRYGRTITRDDAGTTHVSVLDVNGNAVACTTSINTAFGSMVAVPGRGLILNNTMDDFSARPGVPNV
ncbi:MAG: gamma-glutamyltransferase, partial [Candidatus Binatia bacterium]